MRRKSWVAVLAVVALAPVGWSDTYWIEYNAVDGLYPEETGWIRHKYMGGDERWFEDGRLVLNGLWYPSGQDYYEMPMNGTLDPSGPDEMFLCQFRIRVDGLLGYYDPCVGIASDDNWLVNFKLSLDAVYSSFEPGVSASFEPGVPHTFELRSSSMQDYVLAIDGIPAIEGSFWDSLSSSSVQWGDGVYPSGSLARWAFVRFGAVLAPLPGDTDCDGTVDFRDINPFVQALSDADAYEQAYPGCWPENADINADGSVDFGDINPFVGLLIA